MRIGFGYDVHKLVNGRRLVLGGVEIPFAKGLLGHSDADVLLHAMCDAILGALAEGDIGKHFPNTDMEYKDISSLKLLAEVSELLRQRRYAICNIDSTIIAQKPHLAEHIPSMVENIAKILGCNTSQINIKATTSEGLGFAGTGKGMAAYACVLIMKA
ncbi:MAG: 2-C-methyl-D-erythritol 2,4-cyclodiphosphate synthase [Deltaproteobacteria bacterium]|nr:2-C-methyl-D-erythritol 2,4-cyclodiphosphate synthase [Deltaproteobacteria bacterium]